MSETYALTIVLGVALIVLGAWLAIPPITRAIWPTDESELPGLEPDFED